MSAVPSTQTSKRDSADASLLFRQRLRADELLLGSFVKTPTFHYTEILAAAGFDFILVDQEHAPFDQHALDCLALAARGSNLAALVRVANAVPSQLHGILDMGFSGVVVPHVSSVQAAEEVVRACKFKKGERGFSPSGRAGNYGARGVQEHVDVGDNSTTIVAMIEDPSAVDAIDAIVSVEGIDAIFIGRGDLAVALGESTLSAPRLQEAVARVVSSCKAHGKPVVLHVSDVGDAKAMAGPPVTAFVVGSDQGFLRAAANRVYAEFPKNPVR